MSSQFALAPSAPGAMGEDVAPEALLSYLRELGTWRDRRKTELDQLDEACLRSPERDALTGDVMLSMALWQAVAARHDLLEATWDSGRVLETERRRMTTLIWGRLDQRAAQGNALAVSLPEACRLSDTLAASLRSRLQLEGAEPDVSARVRDLRAQIERIRDQVAAIPASRRESAQQVLIGLDRRLVDVTERAKRGADVGGLIPALEEESSRVERDLIVAASRRAQTKNDLATARQRRDELAARGEALSRLVATTVAAVSPAPRLAVPDVTALGDPSPEEVEAYLQRLDRVEAALETVQGAYGQALARRDELAGQIEAYAAKAAALARAAAPRSAAGGTSNATGSVDPADAADDLAELRARATSVLARTPVDLARLAGLAAAQQAYLSAYEPAAAPAAAGRAGSFGGHR